MTEEDGEITRYVGGSISLEIHEKHLIWILFLNYFCFFFAKHEKELDSPISWSVLFDHTQRKDIGKDVYANKKFKAVTTSFYILFLIVIHFLNKQIVSLYFHLKICFLCEIYAS